MWGWWKEGEESVWAGDREGCVCRGVKLRLHKCQVELRYEVCMQWPALACNDAVVGVLCACNVGGERGQNVWA